MKDQQAEAEKEFREGQSKLFYYTIALCVTAIGFSVYQTLGRPLTWALIPLGLAVLSWSLSIYCGLTFFGYVLSNLWANVEMFTIMKGIHPLVGSHPERISAALKGMEEGSKKNAKSGFRLAKYHTRLFYLGMFFFILWHTWEMYLKTN
jgi:hypothetical protein